MSTSICLEHSKCLLRVDEIGIDFSYLSEYLAQDKEVLVGVITHTKGSASSRECFLKLLSLEGGRFLCQDGKGSVYDYDCRCLASCKTRYEVLY